MLLQRERRGAYLGATVQVIPHITNKLCEMLMRAACHSDSDVIITEIGGLVGDIASLPFLVPIRQKQRAVGSENVFYIHAALDSTLRAAEAKQTCPTQHSVMQLRSIGIQPNMLVDSTEKPILVQMCCKIALFTAVPENAVIASRDACTLYSIPLAYLPQCMDQIVVAHFGFDVPPADKPAWTCLAHCVQHLTHQTCIALVGCYVA